jgi:hypothetical protein
VAIQFSIEQSKGLTLMIQFLQNKTYDRAVRDGLRYAGRGGKTTWSKEIGNRYSLAAARIKKDISNPAIHDASASMEIVFSRKPPSGIAYGARGTQTSLSVAIFRGPRIKINRGFMTRKGVPLKALPGPRRIPGRRGDLVYNVKIVQGPSIGSIVLGQGEFSKDIQKTGLDRIQEQYLKGVDRSLRHQARQQ